MTRSPSDPVDVGLTTTFQPPASAHRQLRRVLLRVSDGPDRGAQIQSARPRLTVGRSPVNDLVLTDHSVSGMHIELLLDDRGVRLRDLGSTNGTQVHGLRIREVWIEPGAAIQIGKSTITLLAADEVSVPLSRQRTFGALFGESPAMREVFAVLERIAPTEMSVLIHGETGTGKELVARALHDESPRARGPFVVLDCGSLPRELAEAAILGHKKGAFTGAIADRAGAFEEASGGTLFLDELGELPLELQPKLLRVLDRREVQRIGEAQVRKVDVRVVAATHRDLRAMVSQGEFREDLYFRLSVMTVELPPLRDRPGDVVALAERFLADFRRRSGAAPALSPAAQRALAAERWPGNVRELKNTIERAAYLASGGVIEPADLHTGRRPAPAHPAPHPAPDAPSPGPDAPHALPLPPDLDAQPFKDAKQAVIDAFERLYFARLLARCDHNLSRAAAEAGLTRYYLRELLKRHGLHRGKDDEP